MEKETYFSYVNKKRDIDREILELGAEFDKLIFEGTEEQRNDILENINQKQEVREGILNVLKEARKTITPETLKEWADEYYDR